jgi:hypothetical protein
VLGYVLVISDITLTIDGLLTVAMKYRVTGCRGNLFYLRKN